MGSNKRKNYFENMLWDESAIPAGIGQSMDVNSAQMSLDILHGRQVSPAATEGDDLWARKRLFPPRYDASSSSAKIHKPDHRRTSNSKDFYSKMATSIRDKGFPTPKQSTSCTCQTEVQELRKAINKMNDTLGGMAQKLEQLVKKLDTVAQDARIHRKGTQRLIAAANGEWTPTASEDEA